MKLNERLMTLLFPLCAASALGAGMNINEPSAVGSDDGIHVEARLLGDSIASGRTISVTYRIRNLTPSPIAIAERLCSATYDRESRTVVVSIGAEIPDAAVRHLAVIPSGVEKIFSVGTPLHVAIAGSPLVGTTPRYVQIRVTCCAAGTRHCPRSRICSTDCWRATSQSCSTRCRFTTPHQIGRPQ